jgi:trans-aconitate methyltransferase
MWDGSAYAANTAHHRAFDAGFLSTLGVAAGDRVLDVGCGVGDLTCLVADVVGSSGEVVGLDAEPTMIEVARSSARPNQSFVVAPAQSLSSAVEGPFDVVYSRAVLHWLRPEDLASVLVQAFSLLHPGGVLRVECGGGGNVPEIVSFLDDVGSSFGRVLGAPWNFRDPGWWLDLLLATGYSVADDAAFVRTVAQRRPFDRSSLLGWLRSQCLHAYPPEMAPAAEARIDELRRPDGSYDLTFVRLDALVHSNPTSTS